MHSILYYTKYFSNESISSIKSEIILAVLLTSNIMNWQFFQVHSIYLLQLCKNAVLVTHLAPQLILIIRKTIPTISDSTKQIDSLSHIFESSS